VATASDTAWTTLTVSGAAPWRYLRYRGPANGFCNVAEIEFRGSTTTATATWSGQQVGSPALAGATTVGASTITVTGAGADIWGTADAFHFALLPLTGDGSIVARLVSQQNTDAWAKAGVMIREGTAAGARHAFCFATPGSGVAFQRRTTTNGPTSHSSGSRAGAPRWLRLVRAGSAITAHESADGVTWTLIGAATLSLANPVQVGLAVTSHNDAVTCAAVFEQVVVTPSGSG
jgi:regulation of enolase protein 1 (concanavalin A-like superfamily)